MKKLISAVLVFGTLLSAAFSKSIFDRYFEVRTSVPLAVANNSIAFSDVLQKQLTIDLQKIAGLMPENGLNLTTSAQPGAEVNLVIPNVFSLSFRGGLDVYASFGMSRDLFDFLADGNEMNEELDVGIDVFTDAFYSNELDLKIKAGRLRITLSPGVFKPVLHVTSGDSSVTFSNAEDGTITIGMSATGKVYTPFALPDASILNSSQSFSEKLNEITSDLSTAELMSALYSGIGFDLGGGLEFDFFKYLSLGGCFRVPIVPGSLNYVTGAYLNKEISTSIMDLISEDEEKKNEKDSLFDFATPENYGFYASESTTYRLNRPMRFAVTANFHPFGTYSYLFGQIGVGIRHPFAEDSSETKTYLEYQLGVRMSLFNLFAFMLSTESMNQIFAHRLVLQLNLRLLEIDAGVSATGTSFANSFRGMGIGAFVAFAVGF